MLTDKFKPVLVTLLIVVFGITLSGCKLNFLSDSGSDTLEEISREDYLDLSLLEADETGESQKVLYDTATIERGTFEYDVNRSKASVFEPVTYSSKARFDSGEMTFDKFVVSKMDFVKVGDPIAEIIMKTDSIKITEAELSLERLEDQYEAALKSRKESVETRYEHWDWYEKRDQEIFEKQYRIEDIKWEQNEENYKDRIKTAKENIKEMKANAKKTTINSEYEGYVYALEEIKTGTALKNGQTMLTIIPTNKLYISLSDSDKIYGFGAKYTVNITYGRTLNMEFDAVSMNPPVRTLFGELNTGKAYFEVDANYMETISRANIYVSGVASTVENVLMVPAKAVEESSSDNICYTYVLNEDGSYAKTPFISGGRNQEFYWVISGLKEGTKVIIR